MKALLKEIMQQSVLVCRKEDGLKITACKMFLSDNTFVPVINEDGKVIGLLLYSDAQEKLRKDEYAEVEEAMKPAVCIHELEDEARALQTMRRHKLAYLPVVNNEDRLEGMVSFMMLARRVVLLKDAMKRIARKQQELMQFGYSL
jgi:CBS domain-containing protein